MPERFLSKERITECVSRLQTPKDELVVVGGAALQMFGIKKTSDIDVVVSQTTFTERVLSETRCPSGGNMHSLLGRASVDGARIQYPAWDWSENYYEPVVVGKVSVLPAPNDHHYQVSFDELHDEAVDIDGILVSPPERILDWKQALGRDKDQKDIELIEAYILGETG